MNLALNNLLWLYAIKPNQTKSYLIYMYKEDLALNILQLLICHKTKQNQTKPNQTLFGFICLLTVKNFLLYLSNTNHFQITFTKRWDSNRYYHSRPECCILTYDPAGLSK